MKIINEVTEVDLALFNGRIAQKQLDMEQHLENKRKQVWKLNVAIVLFAATLLLFFWLNILPASLFGLCGILVVLFLGVVGVAEAKFRSPVTIRKTDAVIFWLINSPHVSLFRP